MKAFMAVTAHGITPDWKMIDVLIFIPAVQGRHTGSNFGNILVDMLDDLELSKKPISITADNASSNSTLASRVEHRLGGIFEADNQLLGCMAHVINLTAQDGIRVFGADTGLVDHKEGEMTLSKMDISHLVDEPNQSNVNLASIVLRIHGLATYVCGSPQRRKGFEAVVNFLNSQSPMPSTCTQPRMLILDVQTRWSSTYSMLRCAIQLQLACTTYCSPRGDTSKYSLHELEWEKVTQMTEFLAPLNDVTKILCLSKYPTLSMALPIYMLLIKNIFQVRSQYKASQLILAAKKMIYKLKKYFVLALEKPAPICSMILDLRIKLKHIEKNQNLLAEQHIKTLTTDDALRLFKFEAQVFDCSPSKMQQSESTASHKNKNKKDKLLTIIEADIFGGETCKISWEGN
ncbi:uncharacterized protein VP01_3682g5 [Puccinia sorghi]|uniref:HAT C-terminal dimerisation domain-containing protein n=1 Tax=Puccinia sorghi TaxID=27349 RepID=A0A0L6UW90_9BASI|nr:uncharacterized protein VP01_3682g5 [Puccinia sorghi]